MSASPKASRVWITRTDTGAGDSAKAVERAGFTPLIAPLLTIAAVSTPAACPDAGNAIAFTSPNGVRAFIALSDRRDWPVFTVGDATADAALAAGFKKVKSAGADIDALTALILAAKPDHVTHLSGVHVAGDLAGALTAGGVPCTRTIIYGTQAVTTVPRAVQAAIDAAEPLAVMLYSPKAAHIFNTLISEPLAPLMHCICISPKTDAVLGAGKVFASRQIANAPTEAAMIALLETAAHRA